ncbi:MAG: hypothetical protein NVS9B12_15040 [Vulcanimicrobiaceae bacterium]
MNNRNGALAFILITGASWIVVSGGMVQPMVAKLGERKTLLAGLSFGALGFCLFGSAPIGAVLLAAIPVMCLANVNNPAVQALMSFRVGESEQGELQGALGSLRGVAMMIGPLLFGGTYALFIRHERDWHLPGAPWYLAGLLLFIAMLLAWNVSRDRVEPRAEPAKAA